MAYRSSGAGYADVAGHFRARIEDGELAPGDALPSVQEIREQFGVSAKTVSRALGVLKTEGLVVARGALGTVVAEPQTVTSGVDRLPRLARTGRRYGHGEDSTGHRVLFRSAHDPKICRALDVEPGEEVVVRIRTFRQHGRPTSVGVSVYPPRTWSEVSELASEERMNGYFGTVYTERTGREVSAGKRVGYLRLASKDELDALEIRVPDVTPVTVFVTEVVFHDEDGPVAYWEDVYAPDAKIPLPNGE
ncbi:GntR family transcriptional regulator [Streptomyces sp. WAC00469]|uniref:GntR family transcriptional regulator n=1 Tax=Streptomyces sp. WAC00469 TaxID=2487415 RepID=UPI000F747064|nr:GntR family transcriptional regulator [Streptomyces sp. WAC00469]RSR95429.1 GntR family transcriptional regulator [Streptomyces sp. WAC00469]